MSDKKTTEVEVAEPAPTATQVSTLLSREDMSSQLKTVLPKYLTPERFVRVSRTIIQNTPALRECSVLSLVSSLMELAEVGLEVGSISGEAYLVPFYNKHTKQKEAQAMVGYKGMVKMARNTGKITQASAVTVYEKDVFEYELGGSPKLKHVPNWKDEDPGPAVAWYATAKWKHGGGVEFVVMTPREVEARRKQSKAADKGPWVTHYNQMAEKTVMRKLCRLLPMTNAQSELFAMDDLRDQAIDVTPVDAGDPPKSLEDLKVEMKDAERAVGEATARENKYAAPPEAMGGKELWGDTQIDAIDAVVKAQREYNQTLRDELDKEPESPEDDDDLTDEQKRAIVGAEEAEHAEKEKKT